MRAYTLFQGIAKIRIRKLITGGLLTLALNSVASADQLVLTYLADNGEQTMIIDSLSSTDALTTAATLLAANGTGVFYNSDAGNGNGSLPDIAKALAEVTPFYAPDIAQTITLAVPEQTMEVVAAVNSVSGVNIDAVLAAVHFGPPNHRTTPPFDSGVGLGTGSLVIEQQGGGSFNIGGVVSPN